MIAAWSHGGSRKDFILLDEVVSYPIDKSRGFSVEPGSGLLDNATDTEVPRSMAEDEGRSYKCVPASRSWQRVTNDTRRLDFEYFT